MAVSEERRLRPYEYFIPRSRKEAPALPQRATAHAIRIGLVLTLIFVQFFFLLEAYFESNLFPGNWSGYVTGYTIYLFMDILALGMITLWPLALPKLGKHAPVIQPGGFAGFGITYVAFSVATWAVMTAVAAISTTHSAPAVYTDLQRLQLLVFYALFVGPTEELFFRVAMPPYTGWIFAAIIFGLYHVIAYTAGIGGASGVPLYSQVIFAMLVGVLLWFIYDRFGWGASTGTHTAIDLVQVGVISTIGTTLAHLGVVPI